MKKVLSLVLCIVMVFLQVSFIASAQDECVVYVSVAKHGENLVSNLGTSVAQIPVTLQDKDVYTLDDAFFALHDMLFEGGAEAGYETSLGDYGLYVTKFWGDVSQNFSYMVNGDMVYGPTHEIFNGDFIDFSINQSFYPDTESYTKFDKSIENVNVGDSVALTLLRAEYTAEGIAFSPCSDAQIIINGQISDYITDSDGVVEFCFEDAGKYVVSAKKTKVVNDAEVADICPPVCTVYVNENPCDHILNNIAEKYFASDIINDGNMYWFLADWADYRKIYPESELGFGEDGVQNILDKVIELANTTTSQGDLAKCIISLRALGFDAKNTYTKSGVLLDIPSKLTAMINEESVSMPYYEYTFPYVLIALQQGENYVTEEVTNLLINYALESKNLWQDTTFGVDAMTPVIRALQPYYAQNEAIRDVVDESIDMIKEYQGESGSVGNAASTGLAISSLASVGINPFTVVKGDKSIVDGLVAQANSNLDGFMPEENSFSTEQGLRGLNSLKLYEMGEIIFDFSCNSKNVARATIEYSEPVYTGGGGGGSYVKSTEKEDVKSQETETPKIKAGLSNKHVDIVPPTVISEGKTFEDMKDHKNAQAVHSLAERGVINGRDEKTFSPEDSITRAEFSAILVRALGVPEKTDVVFEDVLENDWFKGAVGTAYHYGIVNGVSKTHFNPNGKITREEAATMVFRASALCGVDTQIDINGARNILAQFPDYKTISDWATQALALCYNEKILDTDDLNVEPKTQATRAQIAQMIYNLLVRAELL